MDKGGAKAERGYPRPTRGVIYRSEKVQCYNIKCLVDANGLSNSNLEGTGNRQVTYAEKVAIGLYWCKVVSLLLQAINRK